MSKNILFLLLIIYLVLDVAIAGVLMVKSKNTQLAKPNSNSLQTDESIKVNQFVPPLEMLSISPSQTKKSVSIVQQFILKSEMVGLLVKAA